MSSAVRPVVAAIGPGAKRVAAATAHQAAALGRAGAPLLRTRPRRSAVIAIALSITGPVLALLTYTILSRADAETLSSVWFQALIVADLAYLVALFSLIGAQIARLVVARRQHTAGAKLHGRMVAVFAVIAAAPAILVAVFFFLVMRLGFDAWFSDQVGSVVRSSQEVAQAYAREHQEAIGGQIQSFAAQLVSESGGAVTTGDPNFQRALAVLSLDAPFSEVYVIDSAGRIAARGADSFLFSFTAPSVDDLSQAQNGLLLVRADQEGDQISALMRLDGFVDAYLYATRPIDGSVIAFLRQTEEGVALYDRLEQNREVWLARFALLYIGFVVLVLSAAIYLGLWFAERLSRPVGRLAAAAQRVREGDLYVRVKEERGDDEIALLSRAFNRMTEEVKRKQDALTLAKNESERRRLFSEAVLAGATPGVIGLDETGRILLLNRAAAELLGVAADEAIGAALPALAPELRPLLDDARHDPATGLERPVKIMRNDEERELLARVTSQRRTAAGGDAAAAEGAAGSGFVLTLDDLTALVSAQRMAAWGDVARRIAHEIKNPLTPIQLSAERLRRKYAPRLGDDSDAFNRYIETIVRQTGDIGRMVDAFVRFAKLPSPKMAREALQPLLKEALSLQSEARAHITYRLEAPDEPVIARLDRGQLLQVLTNLLENASNAIAARLTAEAGGAPGEERSGAELADAAAASARPPEIRLTLDVRERDVLISVADNGVGLPPTDRRKLLEPYVTTRAKGTGLGLAIVLKIVDEHGGSFALYDAPPFSEDAPSGAEARITLPIPRPEPNPKPEAALAVAAPAE